MYYYHFVERDFDKSAELIKEVENDLKNLEPSPLAKMIYHLTVTNNEAYLNWDVSNDNAQKALEICKGLRPDFLREEYETEILSSFIQALMNFGMLDKALDIKEVLLKKSRTVQSKMTQLIAVLLSTEACIVNSQYKEALRLVSINESILKGNEDLEKYSSLISVQKAESLLGTHSYKKAVELSEACLKNLKNTFTTDLNHEYIKVMTIKSEGLLRLKRPDEALDCIGPLTDKLIADVHYQKDSLKGKVFRVIGEILESKGDLLGALKAYQDAETQYESILQYAQPEELSCLYERIAITFVKLRDEIEARRYLSKHIERFGLNHKRSLSIKQAL